MPALRKVASTNHLNQQVLQSACVVNDTLERLSARWKMQVLYSIDQGNNRFTLLKDLFPSLSDHVLGQRLHALQAEHLVSRHPNPAVVPPQVQYFTTPKGEALLAIMRALTEWEQLFAEALVEESAAA